MAPAHVQQEGAASVLLPHPASRLRAPVRACVEAPLGESTALLAVAGACGPRAPLELLCRGVEGVGAVAVQNSLLAALVGFRDLLIILSTSALPKGVYGRELKTVCVCVCVCVLCVVRFHVRAHACNLHTDAPVCKHCDGVIRAEVEWSTTQKDEKLLDSISHEPEQERGQRGGQRAEREREGGREGGREGESATSSYHLLAVVKGPWGVQAERSPQKDK